MEYAIHLIILINIYVILTTATNLLVGLTNLLSLGQAALYGIGAYLTVLALMYFELSLIPSLLFAMLGTGLISLLIAYPSIRLKEDYFILATLGFQLIVFTILYNWISVTRGPFGIPGIPAPKLFGDFIITGLYQYLILSTVLVLIVIFVFYRLINSPFGRDLRGVRDNELSMLAIGKSVVKLKIQAFVISSAFIAISGFLFATYVSYIDPTSFNLDESIFILSALIVGGLGNIRGPVIGAIFVILLPEALRFLGMPDSLAANMRQIIYGLALIILMRYRPQGLAGNYSIK
jgi:branched-chain amino acid transport system permease protein